VYYDACCCVLRYSQITYFMARFDIGNHNVSQRGGTGLVAADTRGLRMTRAACTQVHCSNAAFRAKKTNFEASTVTTAYTEDYFQGVYSNMTFLFTVRL